DRPEVGAALEQMGRERVAETVWVRAEPAERARVEPPSARGEEERVRGAGGELRSRVAEITREPGGRLLAERDHALLSAFPADSHELLLEVDVGEVEVDRLPAPEPGGVHELHERRVPEREPRVPVESVDRGVDRLLLRRVREAARPPRREGRVGHAGRPEREAEERP